MAWATGSSESAMAAKQDTNVGYSIIICLGLVWAKLPGKIIIKLQQKKWSRRIPKNFTRPGTRIEAKGWFCPSSSRRAIRVKTPVDSRNLIWEGEIWWDPSLSGVAQLTFDRGVGELAWQGARWRKELPGSPQSTKWPKIVVFMIEFLPEQGRAGVWEGWWWSWQPGALRQGRQHGRQPRAHGAGPRYLVPSAPEVAWE